MKVLIVDDAVVMLKILTRELNDMGITEIGEAANGQEGAEKAKEGYDAILMDWNMPVMLGIDSVKAIRAQGISTPIMMVTTEGERTNVVLAVQAGANNYLIKPFNKEDFQLKFKQLVGIAV